MNESSASHPGRLAIREWQICHTYASYFTHPLPPLAQLARNLVATGIAESAVTSDGDAWWSNDDPTHISRRAGIRDNPLGTGQIKITVREAGRRATIILPSVVDGYAREGLYQSAVIRYQELFLFGDKHLPPPYVRAHIGACYFMAKEPRARTVLVYPQLKIFQSGVVLVEFRLLSPDRVTYVRDFIDRYVNAPLEDFHRVLVPPGIVAWSPYAPWPEGPTGWLGRLGMIRKHRYHQTAISQHVVVQEEGDFSFQTVPLSLAFENEEIVSTLLRDKDKIVAAAVDAAQAETERLKGQAPDLGMKHSGDVKMFLRDSAMAAGLRVVQEAAKRTSEATINAPRDSPESFHDLALTLMHLTAYLMGARSGPPRGLRFIARGPGRVNRIGEHWHGRPHTHLLRFADQADRAADNETRFGDDFGSILARTYCDEPSKGRQFLPSSARVFEDHGAYIGAGGSLWVYSSGHVRDSATVPWADPNRGQVIYDQHVKTELLDYGYALHRSFAQRAQQSSADALGLLRVEKDLADFEWALQDTGQFGELRDLLQSGWDAFGVTKARARMMTSLRVRQAEAAFHGTVAVNRRTAFLAAIAGALAVPPLASAVLKPLWTWQNWWFPQDQAAAELFLVLLSMGLIGGVVALGFWLTRARSSSDAP